MSKISNLVSHNNNTPHHLDIQKLRYVSYLKLVFTPSLHERGCCLMRIALGCVRGSSGVALWLKEFVCVDPIDGSSSPCLLVRHGPQTQLCATTNQTTAPHTQPSAHPSSHIPPQNKTMKLVSLEPKLVCFLETMAITPPAAPAEAS